jgi:hypothetical protein
MVETDSEFSIWNECIDQDGTTSDVFGIGFACIDNPSPPTVVGERFEDRVEAAALAVWSGSRSASATVRGEETYDAIANLYFTLMKRLFQHSKRNTFTKSECGLFMHSLAARPIAARAHRQSAQLLNKQLKEALATVPPFHIGCLQEAVKRVAVEIASSPTRD